LQAVRGGCRFCSLDGALHRTAVDGCNLHGGQANGKSLGLAAPFSLRWMPGVRPVSRLAFR
jgi:hypothetical protein